jgi:hypothetical protein
MELVVTSLDGASRRRRLVLPFCDFFVTSAKRQAPLTGHEPDIELMNVLVNVPLEGSAVSG